uniref:Uncharacterized protein n=2 Tax=Tetranychus urticae TaxID=32264 RepID=T1KVX6_TETUR
MICIKIRSDHSFIGKDDSGKSVCSTSCMLDDNNKPRKSFTDSDKIENPMGQYQEFNKQSYDTMDSGYNIMKPIANKISYKDATLDKMITSTGMVNNSSDVTYAELSLFSCDSHSGTISRRRLNKFEATEYASIEYSTATQSHSHPFDSTGKHLTYEYDVKMDNRSTVNNNNNCSSNNNNNNNHNNQNNLNNVNNNNVNTSSTMDSETGEMMIGMRTSTTMVRDHSMADGCSETEVSIETPLIESLKPGYRSHDIIIRKVSSSDLRIATPV